MAALRTHKFVDTSDTQEVVIFIRELWASTYLDNHSVLAERRLLLTHASNAPWLSRGQSFWHIKLGVGLALLAWGISECFNNEDEGREIWRDPTFAIFMCFGDLLLLFWMWGLSMQVWRSAGIDFAKLLGLDGTEVAGQRRPEHAVYASATNLTLIFLSVFILFNKAARGVLHVDGSLRLAHSLPILMVLYFIYCFVSPYEARKPWLGFLGQVLAAPCYPVCFRDGYVGDLLTSLVRVLVPLCFSFAFLVFSLVGWLSGDGATTAAASTDEWWRHDFFRLFMVPFLTLFPLWIRLMQCLRRSVETGKRWPHMANAAKYTSAIAVISFGTFQPALRGDAIWRSGFVFATLFQYTWDLTMDWGVVVWARSPGASSYAWGGLALRRVRLLGSLSLYVGVMIGNLLLRFAWTLTLLPSDPTDKSLYGLLLAYLAPLIAAAEIARRMVWGFLRLEHEQLEALSGGGGGALAAAAAAASNVSVSSKSGGAAQTETGSKSDIADLEQDRDDMDEFEPMALGGGKSAQVWDPDGRYSALPLLTLALSSNHNSASSSGQESAAGKGGPGGKSVTTCCEREWVPLPAGLVEYAARWAGLGSEAGPAAKARLVEGAIFAAAVMVLMLAAAAGAEAKFN